MDQRDTSGIKRTEEDPDNDLQGTQADPFAGLFESSQASENQSHEQADQQAPVVAEQPTDLPTAGDEESTASVTLALARDNFELLLSHTSDCATDTVTNAKVHALFIKDASSGFYLDRFHEATESLTDFENSHRDTADETTAPHLQFATLVERLRRKTPQTQVLLTAKRKLSSGLCDRALRSIGHLTARLRLSAHDRRMIAVAGGIHNLIKFRHAGHYPQGFEVIADALNKSRHLLESQPVLCRMLGWMYTSLRNHQQDRPGLEIVGANVLTSVDLYCDTLPSAASVTSDTITAFNVEYCKLAESLLLKEVTETFAGMLEDELRAETACGKRNRVYIYTERSRGAQPLQARLKNNGFQATIIQSREVMTSRCRRQMPDILVMWLHSLPRDVFGTLQYFMNGGIDPKRTPVFLVVRSAVAHKLTPLLELGVEDIISMDGDPEALIFKINKVRVRLESSAPSEARLSQQSGSSGRLSDMNIIDLLQALGPSRRTARVIIRSEDASSEPLLMYLSQGHIIFAQVGELLAEEAIYRALSWQTGVWVVEQVSEDDLPEPNNQLSNESILMEGCRLIDEKAREASGEQA